MHYVKTVKVFSHRGCNLQAPENSLPAFDLALDIGVQGFECDIQMSRDGIPVLFHDDDFERLELPGRISSYNYSELKFFDISSLCEEYEDFCMIPTLQDYLDRYFGKKILLLEIKQIDGEDEEHHKSMLKTVADMVSLKKKEDEFAGVWLSCFDFSTLDILRSHNENIDLIANSEEINSAETVTVLFEERPWLKGVCLEKDCISKEVTAEIHRHEKLAVMYTCNDPLTAKKMNDCGVDILISDSPADL